MRNLVLLFPSRDGWLCQLLCAAFLMMTSLGYGAVAPLSAGVSLALVRSTADKPVKGIIKDETGNALAGVSVVEKGTTNGTITDQDGKYSLSVQSESAVLSVSFIGFSPKEIIVGNQTAIDLVMSQDTKLLSEVVVTALGVKREEKSLGYSVQKVSGTSIQTVKGTNLATSLTGKVSGLWVKNSTEFNEAPSLDLRGETPLLVIDGCALREYFIEKP